MVNVLDRELPDVLSGVSHQTGDGTTDPVSPKTNSLSFSQMHDRLVRSAAYAADCSIAFFFAPSHGDDIALCCFGIEAALVNKAEQALATAIVSVPQDSVLILTDQNADEHPGPLSDVRTMLSSLIHASLPFMAAVRVCGLNNGLDGILVVADRRPHRGLSPAQTYVLITHGAQLGISLTLQNSRDVDRNRSTERLRLLESVVVNANDAVLITEAEPIDQPGPRIVYCNAAFTRTTGYAEAEILGLTPRILQSTHVDRTALDRLRGCLERWEPVEVELLNVRKDGSEFWVELSIVPVADERGWFTHWVSVQRDVSHRKEAEEIATRARIAEVEYRALEAEVQERKRTEARLLHAAFHDSLTGLHNRAYFIDRLSAVLDRPARDGGSLAKVSRCSVLFLDLDRFKLINDSLGHRAGDLLLIEVARRLRSCMRPQDTLARVGGDEFAILIEGADDITAGVVVAERIIDALRQPIALERNGVFSSCSVGVVQATKSHTKPEELLRDADIAMYEAKKQGPGNLAIFDESMHAGAVETLALEIDLRHAIERGEFQVYYQPIYDVENTSISGLEALIRWKHPQRGLVSPGTFIPMAEELGLIREIDRWVLREACGQMQTWQDQGIATGVRLSVNVSSDELRDVSFVPELEAALKATQFDARRLQLEITESVFLRDPETIGRLLKRIRALGVRIALDDFGTGYSSLGYLDRYEIDTIKIDRTFVARMLGQRRAMAILQSIVQLGNILELDIVAEGVETAAQFQALRSIGCGFVQGYLLSRPIPATEVSSPAKGSEQLSWVKPKACLTPAS